MCFVKRYELLGKSGLEAANKAAGLNPATTNNQLAAIDAYYKQRSALAAQNQKTETSQGFRLLLRRPLLYRLGLTQSRVDREAPKKSWLLLKAES
jgi:hypothetical protein